jgi:hypothetical protein
MLLHSYLLCRHHRQKVQGCWLTLLVERCMVTQYIHVPTQHLLCLILLPLLQKHKGHMKGWEEDEPAIVFAADAPAPRKQVGSPCQDYSQELGICSVWESHKSALISLHAGVYSCLHNMPSHITTTNAAHWFFSPCLLKGAVAPAAPAATAAAAAC